MKHTAHARNVIPYVNMFNHVSARDLEEILEWLHDHGYLSEDGEQFWTEVWTLFIKKPLTPQTKGGK